MKLIMVILLFGALTSQAQLNVPKCRILRDVDEFTQSQICDTTLIEFYDVQGHFLFVPINCYPQTWYFVNDVSVKVVIRQTVLGYLLDKRHVRRKWIERDVYWIKGNSAVRFENRNYIMWKL